MAHASHHHLLSIATLANAAVTTTDPCDTAHPQKPILDIAVKEASAASHNTTQHNSDSLSTLFFITSTHTGQ